MDTSLLILAPMRGITTMHYRKAFVRHFQGLDIEMAPFISTVGAERINPKLLKDVLPSSNSGLPLIPQLIGNRADDFVRMACALRELGDNEVNWNLGCPHKPIRKKRRGSGLLPHPDAVDAILDQVCERSPCRISVKVRLGVSDKSELMKLVPVLNRYPLSEVVIHPRTAEQMYTGTVDLDAFEEAFQALELPVCYNGDIDSLAFTLTNHSKQDLAVKLISAQPEEYELVLPDSVHALSSSTGYVKLKPEFADSEFQTSLTLLISDQGNKHLTIPVRRKFYTVKEK